MVGTHRSPVSSLWYLFSHQYHLGREFGEEGVEKFAISVLVDLFHSGCLKTPVTLTVRQCCIRVVNLPINKVILISCTHKIFMTTCLGL